MPEVKRRWRVPQIVQSIDGKSPADDYDLFEMLYTALSGANVRLVRPVPRALVLWRKPTTLTTRSDAPCCRVAGRSAMTVQVRQCGSSGRAQTGSLDAGEGQMSPVNANKAIWLRAAVGIGDINSRS